jgi:hypothetical protein
MAYSRAMLRMRSASPFISLRSPLPLLVIAGCAALLVVAAVALATQPSSAVQSKTPTLGDREALAIVATAVRSGDAAAAVMNEGQARFDDGSWYITVGSAQLHFSQRNRIVVADNDAAINLMVRGAP